MVVKWPYIKEKLKQLPQKPGVYLMEDSLGRIIYVGKAKSLKNRVSQYFYNQRDREPKVAEMIENIHTFTYRELDTELDAFLEECRLIKEIQPRYNRQMKNDRKYCYIKIPSESFPKVLIVHEKAADDALYFGPFTSTHGVEAAVQYLENFYPIRKCTSPKLIRSSSGCLFRLLGSCSGACTGQVSPQEYKTYIEEIEQLLNGEKKPVMRELHNKMEAAIERLEFEKAAQYREYYLGLRHVIGKQRLVQSSLKNKNILALESVDNLHTKLFLIKGNKLLYREVFNTKAAVSEESRLYLKQLLKDKFSTSKNGLDLLTTQDIDEAQIISSYLKKKRRSVLSFWIPATRLKNEDLLEETVSKIITQIMSLN